MTCATRRPSSSQAVVLAVVLGLLAVAAPARADSARAREAYQQGITSIERGDLLGARASFEAAYAESPHYVVLYNLARVCFELNDLVAARMNLQRYLEDGAAQLTQDERRDAEAFLATIDEKLATQPTVPSVHPDRTSDACCPPTSAMAPAPAAPAATDARPSASPPATSGRSGSKVAPGPVDSAVRRKSYAFALGGAGIFVIAASLTVEIWNHTRYLDWQREATGLSRNPPPAEIRTEQDLVALSTYERAAGRADAKRDAIRTIDVVAWAGAGLGVALLGTGTALYLWNPRASGDQAYGATVSGRF